MTDPVFHKLHLRAPPHATITCAVVDMMWRIFPKFGEARQIATLS
jgi:hypothetical protein